MSQPQSAPQKTQPWRKPAGYLALIFFAIVTSGVWDAEALDVFGLSVPVWIFALVMYFTGAVAMWGFQKR